MWNLIRLINTTLTRSHCQTVAMRIKSLFYDDYVVWQNEQKYRLMTTAVLWDGLYWHLKWVITKKVRVSWKSFGAAYESQPFLCPWSSCEVDHCLVMNVLDLVGTREPSQEGASLSEWACLSHWHGCQKLLGSHPSWDKWSFGLWECSTVQSFDVSAIKDCRWGQEGLSRVLHLNEL